MASGAKSLLKLKDITSNTNTNVLNSLHMSRTIIRTKRHILVKWIMPHLGILKLNINGATKSNLCLAGCGSILCSYNCTNSIGFSCFLGVGTKTFVELSALRFGLTLYYELSITNLVVKTFPSLWLISLIKALLPLDLLRHLRWYFTLKEWFFF